MGISKDAPLILGRPFHNTTNACIYVASGRIQFHLDGRKETFAFASGKPVLYEKQERKKQPKKRRTRKPKPIEKEQPSKNKPKPRGTWRKKKEASSTSSSPNPVNIPEENKEEEFPYKEEEPSCKEEQP